MRFQRGQPVAGEPRCPSPPRMLGWSWPGSLAHVPRYATSPMRPETQPRDPELRYASVAVARSPAQSCMLPLCPYQAAWNPESFVGMTAGGGMPGPIWEVQVADLMGRGGSAASA